MNFKLIKKISKIFVDIFLIYPIYPQNQSTNISVITDIFIIGKKGFQKLLLLCHIMIIFSITIFTLVNSKKLMHINTLCLMCVFMPI